MRRGVADRRHLARDPCLLGPGAIEPLAGGRQRGLRDADLRLLGRLRGLRAGERHLGVARRALAAAHRPVDVRALALAGGDAGRERLVLVGQSGERRRRVERQTVLARPVPRQRVSLRGQLGEPAVERRPFRPQAGQRVARRRRLLARGLGGGAQPGEIGHRRLRVRRRRALRLGRRLDQRGRRPRLALRHLGRRRRLAPAGEDQSRLGRADRSGEGAIPLGRPGLAAQRGGARLHLGQQLVQPGEVRLGGAQLLLGILAAHVQPGDAGRLLQHHPPLGRLGGDHGRDPPLADERGRVGAGRRIGEQQADIPGPHVPPVQPVGGSGAPLDPPHHLDLAHRRVVGGGAVDQDRHLGEIARGAGGGAGEDHVFHAAAAHRPGGALAHHPADRLQQVRFAAAVGADDAGQPRLDAQLGGLDEALEAGELQPADAHRAASGLLPRSAVSRRVPHPAWASACPSWRRPSPAGR